MKTTRKSDQLIVVRERESRLHGEGVDSNIGVQQKHSPDKVGLETL
ncbi:hypothetical protein ACJJI4_04310 [Microbulbifer sp. TRSA002]